MNNQKFDEVSGYEQHYAQTVVNVLLKNSCSWSCFDFPVITIGQHIFIQKAGELFNSFFLRTCVFICKMKTQNETILCLSVVLMSEIGDGIFLD